MIVLGAHHDPIGAVDELIFNGATTALATIRVDLLALRGASETGYAG